MNVIARHLALALTGLAAVLITLSPALADDRHDRHDRHDRGWETKKWDKKHSHKHGHSHGHRNKGVGVFVNNYYGYPPVIREHRYYGRPPIHVAPPRAYYPHAPYTPYTPYTPSISINLPPVIIPLR